MANERLYKINKIIDTGIFSKYFNEFTKWKSCYPFLNPESLLANLESPVKQVAGLQIKREKKTFFAGREKGQSKPTSKRQEKGLQNGEHHP